MITMRRRGRKVQSITVRTKEVEDPTQNHARNAAARDRQYTKVIREYIEYQGEINKIQIQFKKVFFWLVCGVFVVIILGSMYFVYIVATKEQTGWEDFGIALSSVVAIINAVHVLPGKIAEYLFPNGGDKDVADFIVQMSSMDLTANKTSSDEEKTKSAKE